MEKHIDLTNGNIKYTLMRLYIPHMISLFGVFSFNLIDTFYISYLGIKELAAISFTFPIILVTASIISGIGEAITSLLSRYLGKKVNQTTIQSFIASSLILTTLISIGIFLLGFIFIQPTFKLIGAPSDLLVYIYQYMHIWYSSVFFIAITTILYGCLRSFGDTKTPGKLMLLSLLINLILDPIFIFGFGFIPRLELKGAAIATLISRLIVFVITLFIILKKKRIISLFIPNFFSMILSWKSILKTGCPIIGSHLLIPAGNSFLINQLSKYGIEVVVAFGLGQRIETFLLTIVLSLSSVLIPFIGQNIGANNVDRIRKSLHICILYSLSVGGILLLMILFTKDYISQTFTIKPDIAIPLKFFLTTMAATYGIFGTIKIISNLFIAIGKSHYSLTIISFQMIIFLVPFVIIGAYFCGYKGIFSAIFVSNFITCLISFYLVKTKIDFKVL